MTKRFSSLTRKLTPWFAAGMLLQAGGCQFDVAEGAASLISAVGGSIISNIVYGAFNLI